MAFTASDIMIDIDQILVENGMVFTIERPSDTTDGMGNVTAISDDDFWIYALIQDITKKDREIHDMGLAVEGNVKAFFKQTYTQGDATYTIKEGDILLDRNSNRWRAEKILAERNRALKVVILKNIGNEGSS